MIHTAQSVTHEYLQGRLWAGKKQQIITLVKKQRLSLYNVVGNSLRHQHRPAGLSKIPLFIVLCCMILVQWKIPKEEVTMEKVVSNNLQVSAGGHVLKAKHMYGTFQQICGVKFKKNYSDSGFQLNSLQLNESAAVF